MYVFFSSTDAQHSCGDMSTVVSQSASQIRAQLPPARARLPETEFRHPHATTKTVPPRRYFALTGTTFTFPSHIPYIHHASSGSFLPSCQTRA